jgi:hypothetical protein
VAREVDGRVQLRVLEEHPEREDHHEADVAQQRRQVPKSSPCEYSEYPCEYSEYRLRAKPT